MDIRRRIAALEKRVDPPLSEREWPAEWRFQICNEACRESDALCDRCPLRAYRGPAEAERIHGDDFCHNDHRWMHAALVREWHRKKSSEPADVIPLSDRGERLHSLSIAYFQFAKGKWIHDYHPDYMMAAILESDRENPQEIGGQLDEAYTALERLRKTRGSS